MEKTKELVEPDLSYLAALSEGDKEFEAEMIQTYLDEIPDHILRIEEALSQSDWKKLMENLHSLKSKLSIMGFQDLYKKVAKLEANCKNQISLEEVSTEVPEVCSLLRISLSVAEKELQIRK